MSSPLVEIPIQSSSVELLGSVPDQAKVDGKLSEEIKSLQNENRRLMDKLSVLEGCIERQNRELKERKDKSYELQAMFENYGKLAVEKDILNNELDHLRALRLQTNAAGSDDLKKANKEMLEKVTNLQSLLDEQIQATNEQRSRDVENQETSRRSDADESAAVQKY